VDHRECRSLSNLSGHNILDPVLGRPSKKESKTTLMPKIDRTIRTKTTCVTKVEEMYIWQWRIEHNYLEKE
jgi:hypothetical protein